ncbi:MAG TPA: hypothetical protein VER96_39240 [Polyangiaceae bacterium]|nr:hypothetical protein [Polyangiaceae bacterium]
MRAIHVAWFLVALTAPGVVACGGTVSISPGSAGAAAVAGSDSGGASGSAASAGSAGSGAAGSCVYDGKTYPDGARFPDTDGCNSCFCQSGSVGCTLVDCAVHCQFGGKFYQPGDTFKNDCNTCTCQSDGSIECTQIACADQCTDLQQQYADALKQAKACDPTQRHPCTGTASAGIVCGCSTPVNPDNTDAIALLADLAKRSPAGCYTPCTTCIEQTSVPTCIDRSCESVPIQEGGAACKVDGILYPSGSSVLLGCTVCACDNGQFGFCSSMKCPPDDSTTCPSGMDFAWQCAACGPSGGCLIGEYSCLPTCDGEHPCAVGACSDDGHCAQICR